LIKHKRNKNNKNLNVKRKTFNATLTTADEARKGVIVQRQIDLSSYWYIDQKYSFKF
jgi:hypothetical protein